MPLLCDLNVLVASDAKARYFLLSFEETSEGTVVAVTRRDGPSGVSFSMREIRLEPLSFRYISEGDTLAELDEGRSSYAVGEFGLLVEGSISDIITRTVVGIAEGKRQANGVGNE